jgi:hypothetical protein
MNQLNAVVSRDVASHVGAVSRDVAAPETVAGTLRRRAASPQRTGAKNEKRRNEGRGKTGFSNMR